MKISTDKVKTVYYILLPTNFVGSDYVLIDEWIKIIPMEFYLLPENKGKNTGQVSSRFNEIMASIPDENVTTNVTIELDGINVEFPALTD